MHNSKKTESLVYDVGFSVVGIVNKDTKFVFSEVSDNILFEISFIVVDNSGDILSDIKFIEVNSVFIVFGK